MTTDKTTSKSDSPSLLDTITFSVVVPTRDRPSSLTRCVQSLGEQCRPPAEVIVVDDGDLSPERLLRLEAELDNGVSFTVTRSDPQQIPGSGSARNTGAREATGSVVIFVDDDTVLGPDYLERLYKLYDLFDASDLAGIGGLLNGQDPNITSHPYHLDYLFDTLFYQGVVKWEINKAGFSRRSYIPGFPPETLTRADWLAGSNMSFKRDVVTEYQFPQWEPGVEPAEDLIMGWTLREDGYHSLIDPNLPLKHHIDHNQRESDLQTYIRHGRNTIRAFVQLGQPKYTPLFLWAVFGTFLREMIAPLYTGQCKIHYKQGIGFLIGVLLQACRSRITSP